MPLRGNRPYSEAPTADTPNAERQTPNAKRRPGTLYAPHGTRGFQLDRGIALSDAPVLEDS